MRITIHRGSNQIGGCITEIESNGYRAFIDFGEQLPGSVVADTDLPAIERAKTMKTFEALQQIKIGGIIVTPLFIDHSAFDAYMFIVEADGKRILHTGDFRGHGFRGKGLIPALRKYATGIDYIISEGSNVLRPLATIQTEQELQKEFEGNFRNNKYNFIFVSSTNIDRIFALYHAAKKAGRCFICDDYQETLLKIVSRNHKERSTFYDIDYEQTKNPKGRFFVLKRHGKEAFSFQGKLKPYLDNHGFCMIIRVNLAFKPLLDEYVKNLNAKIYYSMWKGYIDSKSPAFNNDTAMFFKPYEIEFMHTSGHANIETLKNVFDAVNPKYGIIPIHTEAPQTFNELFSPHKIIPIKDGKTIDQD